MEMTEPEGGTVMAVWTMTSDGIRVRVVPAAPGLRCGRPPLRPGDVPVCGTEPVRAHWTDEPETVAECDDCLEPVAENRADENEHRARCLHCRQVIGAKAGVVRRP